MNSPSSYLPACASELIGPARSIGLVLERKVSRIQPEGQPFKLLLNGDPGCGKSSIVSILARQLARHELGITKLNGCDVGADAVRNLRDEFFTASMFSDWRVLIIEEADKMGPQAQTLMLTLLDDLPKFRAILATSNQNTSDLIERFQTRFQVLKVEGPSPDEISALLDRWQVPRAHLIAAACRGNVRSALLDSESQLDFIN